MINDLIDMQFDSGMTMTFPNQKFFKPTEAFWDELAKMNSKFIDCGTGAGHLPVEADERGIPMMGCDIHKRDGFNPRIQIMPAHRMPFNDKFTALVCRPDHSGWVEGLIPVVLSKGARFIYVGLPDNLYRDVPDDSHHNVIASDVGEDGECMVEVLL